MVEELFDSYIWTKENKTIVHDKHQIPGLKNFTHWNTQGGVQPSPLHYHANILEMHCMVKGQRTSVIEDNGVFRSYTFAGNTIFLTYPFEIHGNGDAVQPPCEFYAFQIDLSEPGNLLGLNHEYSHELSKLLMSQRHRQLRFHASHLAYLRTAFNLIAALGQTADPETERMGVMAGVQFLTCFLYSLSYLTPVENENAENMDDAIFRSIEYLNAHLSESVPLSQLACKAGYSLSHYKKKFKKEVGITPSEYVLLKKLDYAKHALMETNVSITDLAFSLGFSSSNYFCAVFKKFMNCTPKEWRKKNL